MARLLLPTFCSAVSRGMSQFPETCLSAGVGRAGQSQEFGGLSKHGALGAGVSTGGCGECGEVTPESRLSDICALNHMCVYVHSHTHTHPPKEGERDRCVFFPKAAVKISCVPKGTCPWVPQVARALPLQTAGPRGGGRPATPPGSWSGLLAVGGALRGLGAPQGQRSRKGRGSPVQRERGPGTPHGGAGHQAHKREKGPAWPRGQPRPGLGGVTKPEQRLGAREVGRRVGMGGAGRGTEGTHEAIRVEAHGRQMGWGWAGDGWTVETGEKGRREAVSTQRLGRCALVTGAGPQVPGSH